MEYKLNPNAAQKTELLKALKAVLDKGNDFAIMLDLDTHALMAGSDRMRLVEFLATCMLVDEDTAQLLMNAVLNYILNKLNVEGCDSCPAREGCDGVKKAKQRECGDEALVHTLKKLLSQMRVAKN